ncbi:hypothetical protein O6P43_026582 [Quillaja saponaria]|uniref:Uncharacterized protein n=1 Tax=Quillaja saponaria TaxID=32244 RepID=A0AAD7L4D8_QUISA|nr:hypothetical protein O6P43_026582 [Quillaja saponaria]
MRYFTPVSFIHAAPPGAPVQSCSAHSTSSSMSSQHRRRTRTNVPGPLTSYGCADAVVGPSDMHISSPPHMSQPPYVPYFQYGSTRASYDSGMGSGMQATKGFSSAHDMPQLEDPSDTANVPPRQNPARRRRPHSCGTGSFFVDRDSSKSLFKF